MLKSVLYIILMTLIFIGITLLVLFISGWFALLFILLTAVNGLVFYKVMKEKEQ